MKMLAILSIGLFPLGLIAILASIESARQNNIEHRSEVQARVQLKAQRINGVILRSALTIRAASAAISSSLDSSEACRTTLRRLERAQGSHGRYALYGRGNVIACATEDFTPPAITALPAPYSLVGISSDGEALRFALRNERGALEGYGEFSRESIAEIAELPGTKGEYDLELSQGTRKMVLRNSLNQRALARPDEASTPVVGGRMQLKVRSTSVPISAAELLIILLPILMWLAAGFIGWLIAERLLLRPLVRMQRAVASYQPGDEGLDLPPLSTPAREISELGQAFDTVTRTVARHEADLEAAVERQKRLVREVHHRVKNNLQVVASLLNLHARGATNEDVAAAYASIQRRVDALAVVHRNHYAELEENRGVALKSLIPELGANLRATAPASATSMQIRLNVEALNVTQDVAVSVAFLVTEIVEFAMFCGAPFVAISVERQEGSAARLALESDSLKSGVLCDQRLFERFERIVTGLSRQLRSNMERDLDQGRYSLLIAILDKPED
jgi:two-component sensor histidine kinase